MDAFLFDKWNSVIMKGCSFIEYRTIKKPLQKSGFLCQNKTS